MPPPLGYPKDAHGKDWVALVLAFGLASAVNFITFAVLWAAIHNPQYALSENGTQVLIAAFGGLTGILGSYIGFRAGAASVPKSETPELTPVDQGGTTAPGSTLPRS